jgi:hypothetical protein
VCAGWLFAERWRVQRIAAGLAVAAALTLGALSFARVGDYRSEIDLYRSSVAADPRSWEAQVILAALLIRAGEPEGYALLPLAEHAKADHLARVLHLQPDPILSHVDLAAHYTLAGDEARAHRVTEFILTHVVGSQPLRYLRRVLAAYERMAAESGDVKTADYLRGAVSRVDEQLRALEMPMVGARPATP